MGPSLNYLFNRLKNDVEKKIGATIYDNRATKERPPYSLFRNSTFQTGDLICQFTSRERQDLDFPNYPLPHLKFQIDIMTAFRKGFNVNTIDYSKKMGGMGALPKLNGFWHLATKSNTK